jgi:uncharacterized protein (DUF362 family)
MLKSSYGVLKAYFLELHYKVYAPRTVFAAAKTIETPVVKAERSFVFLGIVKNTFSEPLFFPRPLLPTRKSKHTQDIREWNIPNTGILV